MMLILPRLKTIFELRIFTRSIATIKCDIFEGSTAITSESESFYGFAIN